jgi:aldehyde dehydrogenase (NAD+)
MSTILIAGRWQSAASGETIPVIDPSTSEIIAHVDRGNAADVDIAVNAARDAANGPWRSMTATERGRVLSRAAGLILRDADELAAIEARDTGKPALQARAEMDVAARYFEFYGGAADKIHGQVIPFLDQHQALVTREPLGVTAHIIPWNYPAVMFGRTIAPSLAVGNAAVLKPSEDACLSTLRLARLLAEAGLPDGVLNVVTGYGAEAGAALSAHPGIDLISFTGSPGVGTAIQQAAAVHHVRCVLELGGKSPQILFEDADFEQALPVILQAILQNAGQTCSAGSRLLVQRSRYEEWMPRLQQAFSAASAGAPHQNRQCGPVINARQHGRVQRFIDDARSDGVPVLAQGSIADGVAQQGLFIKPILFGPVPREHCLAREEVFGPVLAVLPFDDEADAVALANDTAYGLVAGVWTRDASRQSRVARELRCGQVFLNCYGAGGGVELPFGGIGRSGHGREKGLLALDETSNVKTIVQRFVN